MRSPDGPDEGTDPRSGDRRPPQVRRSPSHDARASRADGSTRVAPTPPAQREPVLDVLRGFAMLGILLINVEYMRGGDFYAAFSDELDVPGMADRIAHFATGWLAAGKFLSSFAILFGIGAALTAGRVLAAGRSPRPLLARRYLLLLAFGLAHMVLLFPGDILFLYGLTGLVLLGFVRVPARKALWWAGGLLTAMTLAFVALTGLTVLAPEPAADDPAAPMMEDLLTGQRDQVVAAYTQGSYVDVVRAHASQSTFIQVGQAFLLPWVLALFLLGVAVVRAGVLEDLNGHRRLLRRTTALGLGLGLPANLGLGALGPFWGGATFQPGADAPGLLMAAAAAQMLAAPLLAAGYLSALALLALRAGTPRRLAGIGRMALSAYLTQSLLALVVFAGLGLYDRLGTLQALMVVAAVWAILLVACPAWMRRFRHGPVEWLWRSLTYGRRQPLRVA
jgi:uncharacterized protein